MEKGREGKEEGEEGREVLTRRGQWVHCGSYNTGSWKPGLPAPLYPHTWNLLKAVCRVAILHKNLATRNIINTLLLCT